MDKLTVNNNVELLLSFEALSLLVFWSPAAGKLFATEDGARRLFTCALPLPLPAPIVAGATGLPKARVPSLLSSSAAEVPIINLGCCSEFGGFDLV